MQIQNSILHANIYSGHLIKYLNGKDDYLYGVKLVALKRAVVVCFLVREEEATA